MACENTGGTTEGGSETDVSDAIVTKEKQNHNIDTPTENDHHNEDNRKGVERSITDHIANEQSEATQKGVEHRTSKENVTKKPKVVIRHVPVKQKEEMGRVQLSVQSLLPSPTTLLVDHQHVSLYDDSLLK